ncbi:Uncharacterised protein at_DN1112 [Pycnogonum litorale]
MVYHINVSMLTGYCILSVKKPGGISRPQRCIHLLANTHRWCNSVPSVFFQFGGKERKSQEVRDPDCTAGAVKSREIYDAAINPAFVDSCVHEHCIAAIVHENLHMHQSE